MAIPKFKPGSRAQQIYEKWSKEGLDAAIAFGPTFGLSAKVVTSWVASWGDPTAAAAAPPKAAKVAKAPKAKPELNADGTEKPKLPKRIGGYKFNPTGKQRVRCSYMPDRLGWLIDEGPEVSEIRWDDDFQEIYIINKFIVKVDTESPKRKVKVA